MKKSTCLSLLIPAWLGSSSAPAAEPVQMVSPSNPANEASGGAAYAPRLSPDGRWVAFLSASQNLVTNDDRAVYLDVFLRDLAGGGIRLVSANTNGVGGGDADAFDHDLTPDGRHAVFASAAGNLVAGDTNQAADIFLRDVEAGQTELISVDVNGATARHPFPVTNTALCSFPLLSTNARWVAFESLATNLVSGADTNRQLDVFVRDRESRATRLLSASTNGLGAANGRSTLVAMTPDGAHVLFHSTATDLVEGATNQYGDLYVANTLDGTITWASRNMGWAYSPFTNGYRCLKAALSDDGQVAAFHAALPTTNPVLVVWRNVESGSTRLLTTNALEIGQPQISADGRYVAFETNSHVWVYDRQFGSNVWTTAVTNEANPYPVRANTPVLTPDGQRLFYVAAITGVTSVGVNTNAQIYRVDLDTGAIRLASADPARQPARWSLATAVPSVSDDGRFAAFEALDDGLAAGDQNRTADVLVRDLATDTTVLASQRAAALPSSSALSLAIVRRGGVSSDGNQVLYGAFDGTLVPSNAIVGRELYLRDLRTWNQQCPTDVPQRTNHFISREAVLTADGRHAAFMWVRDSMSLGEENVDQGDILWWDLEAGTNVLLANSPTLVAAYSRPALSPDGRGLVFQGYRANNLATNMPVGFRLGSSRNIFLYDVVAQTNMPISAFPNSGPGAFAGDSFTNAVYSPNGRWLLFAGDGLVFARQLGSPTNQLLNDDMTVRLSHVQYAFSGDSRWVAFSGAAQTNGLFARDLASSTNRLICSDCDAPSLNGDGRYVAYGVPTSPAGQYRDLVVQDLQTGITNLVTRSWDGARGGDDVSSDPQISPDGRFVVFASKAGNLVPGDDNQVSDIFVRYQHTGQTLLLSANLSGTGAGNGASSHPVLSGDGRTVVFQSFATDLAPGDYNEQRDIFVARLGAGDTDGDGLDDDWELAYFETLVRDGSGDFDGDGLSDRQEWQAGTDPTNGGSVLRAWTVAAAGNSSVTVWWQAVPGLTYQVQFKDSVSTAGWTDLPGTVTATSLAAAKVDDEADSQPHRFYRVVLVP